MTKVRSLISTGIKANRCLQNNTNKTKNAINLTKSPNLTGAVVHSVPTNINCKHSFMKTCVISCYSSADEWQLGDLRPKSTTGSLFVLPDV